MVGAREQLHVNIALILNYLDKFLSIFLQKLPETNYLKVSTMSLPTITELHNSGERLGKDKGVDNHAFHHGE